MACRVVWAAVVVAGVAVSASFGGPRLAVIQPSGGRIGPAGAVITGAVGGGTVVAPGGFGFVGSGPGFLVSDGFGFGRTGFGGVGAIRVYGNQPFFSGNRVVYIPGGTEPFYTSTTFVNGEGRRVIWSTQPPPTASEREAAGAAPVPPTALEAGWLALAAGEAGVAVEAFEDHLATKPEDYAAFRGLAVALLREGRVDESFAVMGTAYASRPDLATEVMPMADLGGRRGAREAFRVAVREARRVGSSSGFLTAAVIAQAEGRPDVARRMLTEAAGASLTPEVAEAMAAALDRRGR